MEKKATSYLTGVRFDKKLLNSRQAKYLRNIRLPILLIITIIVMGVYSLITIPRRLNPEIKIPIVIVNTILPGASPEDVESLVTIPLERAIGSVERLDSMQSTSRESNSTIILQFLSTVDTKEAQSDVQLLVDTVSDLPSDATTPKIQSLDFEDQPVWTFIVTTKLDEASLMRFSDELKDRLEDVSRIDRVLTTGMEDQEIEVIVNLEKAKEYNLSPLAISQLVNNNARSFPAGNVNSLNSSFSLTINKDITTIEDVRNLRIAVGDSSVRLGDIAAVAMRSKANQKSTYFASLESRPTRTVQFFVFRKKTSNIDASYIDAKGVVDDTLALYKDQFSIVTVMNTSEEITNEFADLFGEFRTTIILVFVLLFVFLGLRQAIISSITVPLTFLSSFAIIQALGRTLNFLTTFSFLLALGLLIDDTIVTVAAMTRYYRTGKFTPFETGVLVWRDFIVPLWSTTITTIWAFVPLLLSTGIIGEFIKTIPIVVTTTMLSSTTIAVLITMPLMIVFLKPQFPRRVTILFIVLGILAYILFFAFLLPKNNLSPVIILASLILLLVAYYIRGDIALKYKAFVSRDRKTRIIVNRAKEYVNHGVINIEGISVRYRRIIERILSSRTGRKRTIIAIAAFTMGAYLLLPLGFVRNEFFPKQEANLIYANVDLPAGTKNEIVTSETLRLLDELRNNPKIEYIVAEVGQSFSTDGNRSEEPDAILYTIHLPGEKERNFSSIAFAQEMREKYQEYSKGKFSILELSGGPPAGADIQVKLLGDDLGVLDTYAQQTVTFLQNQEGITNIDKSLKQGTSKVVFQPDKSSLIEQEVTTDQIALWLRTYASGFILDTVRFGDDENDIVFKTSTYDNQSLAEVGGIEIPVQNGSIPLLSLGKLRIEANPTTISRENQKRTVSVAASVVAGHSITQKNSDLTKFVETLELPPGYSWTTGGVNEENQKSVNSILQAMVISFLLILITMVIEFGSFRQALMSMLIIPISTASVFYVFALTRTPLSFAALIGVLALFGIVVTHAIVVIEKINENRRHGLDLKDAITDAAANRLEPVLLTSLATIVGLLPITIADPFWRGLGGAIISGLLFSGAIKLFFIPVLYYNFFNGSEQLSRKSRF